MVERFELYGYWRSSAAYRVRIALNLKGLEYEQVPVHLARDGGEQHRPQFHEISPQAQVPVLRALAGGSARVILNEVNQQFEIGRTGSKIFNGYSEEKGRKSNEITNYRHANNGMH